VTRLDWFDEGYDHMYQGVGTVAAVPDTSELLFGVQRSSNLVLCSPPGDRVKVVQLRLGHKTAKETLDTYGHLWPDTDDRTRQAVDSILSARSPAHMATTG
jgi:hypothetical protein